METNVPLAKPEENYQTVTVQLDNTITVPTIHSVMNVTKNVKNVQENQPIVQFVLETEKEPQTVHAHQEH